MAAAALLVLITSLVLPAPRRAGDVQERVTVQALLADENGMKKETLQLIQRLNEKKKPLVAEKFHDSPDTPGWLVERIYHVDAIRCPWLQSGSQIDEDCKERTGRIMDMRGKISTCKSPFKRSDKAIGHRGAPLVAPEETVESWRIAAESGAGYLECDVSVTGDLDMVCRHGTCDLAFTTDIIGNHPDLREKCSQPFKPGSGKEATCCTYDFTASELNQLCAAMESVVNASADSYEGYVLGPPGFRSGAIAQKTCHKIVPYRTYLGLLRDSGYHAIPELKDTATEGVQKFLASKDKDVSWLANEFAEALVQNGFQPWPVAGSSADSSVLFGVMQTFDYKVAESWKRTRPEMTVEYMWNANPPPGKDCNSPDDCGGREILQRLQSAGVELFSPPINVLLASGPKHTIVPSATANLLREIKVRAIGSWSLERQGCSATAAPLGPSAQLQPAAWSPCGEQQAGGFYYEPLEGESTFQHSDVLEVLDALFRQVGIVALFSDFPATVAAYANCVLEP